MEIEISQISCPVDPSYFICGICQRLAINPRVHNGGFKQRFCQRIFCERCASLRAENPNYRRFNLNREKYETTCPIGRCTRDFHEPYFTFMGLLEAASYAQIKVECSKCNIIFGIYDYEPHLSSCTQASSSVRGGLLESSLGHDINNVSHEFLDQLRTSRRHHFSSVSDNISIINIPNIRFYHHLAVDQVAPICFKSMTHIPVVQFNLQESGDQLKERIKHILGVSKDLFDIVKVKHSVLQDNESVGHFLRDLPVGYPVNLVPKRATVAQSKFILNFKFSGASEYSSSADVVQFLSSLDHEE